MRPVLAAPSERYRVSFMSSVAEYDATETTLAYERRLVAEDFETYARNCESWSRGQSLPENWTPISTRWLVAGDHYLGSVAIRHSITELMHRFGGHIGYIIRPSARRKGFGTLICRLALDEARGLGVERALLTCADTNVASARIIERNGGVLQDQIQVGTRPSLTRRYWIDL